MLETILVWILVVGESRHGRTPPVQMGFYAQVDDCQRVADSKPMKDYDVQCVQVRVPVAKGQR